MDYLLLGLFWVVFNFLIFMLAGLFIGSTWPAWALISAFWVLWAGYTMTDDNIGGAVFRLIIAVINGVTAWLIWRNDRNRRNRKKFRLGALGYKARAIRDRLVASMPQGRKPGLNPT